MTAPAHTSAAGKPTERATYFVRAEHASLYWIMMRDTEGFETVVDRARTGERAQKLAHRWQDKEDRAIAKAAQS